MDIRQCPSCARNLPNSEFALYKASNGKFYSRSKCTECLKSYKKSWVQANRDRSREYALGYNTKNKARILALTHMSYGARKYGECDCCSRDDVLKFVLNRPDGMVIDHIKTAAEGGKHCLFNLQYMTVSDHCAKSAKEK